MLGGSAEKNSLGDLTSGGDDQGYRLSASYVDQFADDTFGVAIGFSRSNSAIQENQVGLYEPWQAIGDNWRPGVPAGTYYSDGIKALRRTGYVDRDGVMATLQFRPSNAWTSTLDLFLTPPALERQREAIRQGHCRLLAETQVPAMARIQIARDKSMAQVLVEAQRQYGQTTVLITGAGHVLRTAGVPVHLPKDLTARIVIAMQHKAPPPSDGTPAPADDAMAQAIARAVPADADLVWASPWREGPDHCETLRQQLQ